MSWTCRECGQVLDQSDASTHAEKREPPTLAQLQERIQLLESFICKVSQKDLSKERLQSVATVVLGSHHCCNYCGYSNRADVDVAKNIRTKSKK